MLFDGTLWRDDEMIVAGVGTEDRQADGAYQRLRPRGHAWRPSSRSAVKRKVFVHMNNTNPILLADSPERAAIAKAGWEAAHDGMEISAMTELLRPEEFERRLRQIGEERYHSKHPFHQLLHEGKLN